MIDIILGASHRARLAPTPLLVGFLVLSAATSASAQDLSPAKGASALTAADYAARAQVAMADNNPMLAAQLLMLSHEDHGDVEALYVAGLAFQKAGRSDLSFKAWNTFLCNSADDSRRQEVRAQLRALKRPETPEPCTTEQRELMERLQMPSATAHHRSHTASPTPSDVSRASTSTEPRMKLRQSDLEPPRKTQWNFEVQHGLRIGANVSGVTWAPGLWFDKTQPISIGLFAPIFIGDNQGLAASIGIEPRVSFALSDGLRAEAGLGLHTLEGPSDASYTLSGGINFKDVVSLRLTRENFAETGDPAFADFSATYLDATFTGKTGNTIVAIEAGLSLIAFALLAGD